LPAVPGLVEDPSIEHSFVYATEQVYGRRWTVADPADLAGFDFADRLASAK